uniref:DUF4537 domain-containing protein n=1 Tax=Macrostomum lignano TaxID=282301 RepID=A0A1I8JLB4_9PLAT
APFQLPLSLLGTPLHLLGLQAVDLLQLLGSAQFGLDAGEGEALLHVEASQLVGDRCVHFGRVRTVEVADSAVGEEHADLVGLLVAAGGQPGQLGWVALETDEADRSVLAGRHGEEEDAAQLLLGVAALVLNTLQRAPFQLPLSLLGTPLHLLGLQAVDLLQLLGSAQFGLDAGEGEALLHVEASQLVGDRCVHFGRVRTVEVADSAVGEEHADLVGLLVAAGGQPGQLGWVALETDEADRSVLAGRHGEEEDAAQLLLGVAALVLNTLQRHNVHNPASVRLERINQGQLGHLLGLPSRICLGILAEAEHPEHSVSEAGQNCPTFGVNSLRRPEDLGAGSTESALNQGPLATKSVTRTLPSAPRVQAPDAAVRVLRQPLAGALVLGGGGGIGRGDLLDNVRQSDIVANLVGVHWVHLDQAGLVAGFGGVDHLEVPGLDQAVDADSHELAGVHHHLRYEIEFVMLHVAPFAAAQHFTVWQFNKAFNIGDLSLAELANGALQLQAESDVASTGRGQEAFKVLRPRDPVDVLGEGLGPQHGSLAEPVPDGEHEVWLGANSGQVLAARIELAVAVGSLRAAPQYTVQPQRGVFVHQHVWRLALLGHGEVPSGRVHRHKADTAAARAAQKCLPLGGQIHHLDQIAGHKADVLLVQDMQIVPLGAVIAVGVDQLEQVGWQARILRDARLRHKLADFKKSAGMAGLSSSAGWLSEFVSSPPSPSLSRGEMRLAGVDGFSTSLSSSSASPSPSVSPSPLASPSPSASPSPLASPSPSASPSALSSASPSVSTLPSPSAFASVPSAIASSSPVPLSSAGSSDSRFGLPLGFAAMTSSCGSRASSSSAGASSDLFRQPLLLLRLFQKPLLLLLEPGLKSRLRLLGRRFLNWPLPGPHQMELPLPAQRRRQLRALSPEDHCPPTATDAMDADAAAEAEFPPRVLQASCTSRLTMFGDVADRHVIFLIEISPAMAPALSAAKTDLIEALLRLAYRGDADTSFNLLRFGGRELVQWSDRLVLATPRTATVAAQWIRELQLCEQRRGPGLLDALTAAMSDSACQAVHLVTAGATAADASKNGDLLDSLRQRLAGSSGQLRPVHCAVCLPTPDGLDRLCELAAGSGGSVASVQLGDATDDGVHSVTRLLTADRPSARLSRDAGGRLCNVETPAGAPLSGSSRALIPRPSSEVVKAKSALEAALVGRRVLARRHGGADGVFYSGRVVAEVSPRVLLVEFPAATAETEASQRQETPLADLVSLDDALRRSTEPGDFVLAPAATDFDSAGAYRPARVLRTGPQLTVAVAGPGQAPDIRRLAPGTAAWIPRELYCSLELEALSAAAKRLEEAPPLPLPAPDGGSGEANRLDEVSLDETAEPQPEAADPQEEPPTVAEEKAPEESPEEKPEEPKQQTATGQDEIDSTHFELFDGEDNLRTPRPTPPPSSLKPQLRRRPKRQPAQAPIGEADAETPRVEAYRRAMEAARSAEIRRRRAELEADGLLRDPGLRRSQAAAIAAATAAASLSSRGALHTAAVIEARLRREERREAAELRRAEADAEVARQRWWGAPSSGQHRLQEPPPPPELLRLRRLKLLAGDGQRLFSLASDEAAPPPSSGAGDSSVGTAPRPSRRPTKRLRDRSHFRFLGMQKSRPFSEMFRQEEHEQREPGEQDAGEQHVGLVEQVLPLQTQLEHDLRVVPGPAARLIHANLAAGDRAWSSDEDSSDGFLVSTKVDASLVHELNVMLHCWLSYGKLEMSTRQKICNPGGGFAVDEHALFEVAVQRLEEQQIREPDLRGFDSEVVDAAKLGRVPVETAVLPDGLNPHIYGEHLRGLVKVEQLEQQHVLIDVQLASRLTDWHGARPIWQGVILEQVSQQAVVDGLLGPRGGGQAGAKQQQQQKRPCEHWISKMRGCQIRSKVCGRLRSDRWPNRPGVAMRWRAEAVTAASASAASSARCRIAVSASCISRSILPSSCTSSRRRSARDFVWSFSEFTYWPRPLMRQAWWKKAEQTHFLAGSQSPRQDFSGIFCCSMISFSCWRTSRAFSIDLAWIKWSPISMLVMSILDRAGSSGNSTICLPSRVRPPVLSKAPSSHNWYMDCRILSCGGGSMKPNHFLVELAHSVKPVALATLGAARSTAALLGVGLADWEHLAMAEFCELTGVNNVADPVNSERSLSNVGGNHAFAHTFWRLLKDLRLQVRRQLRVNWQHRQLRGGFQIVKAFLDLLAGDFNVLLAGHEHQDVTGGAADVHLSSAERALVSFIQDEAGVVVQVRLPERLAQQDTVCHVLDERVRSRAVLEADRVADFLAEFGAELLGNALSNAHCGHSARLCAADHAELGVALLVQVLSQLRGLAAAGLAYYHLQAQTNARRRSRCSRQDRTSAEPFLHTMAMSLVGSRTGTTGSGCLVNTIRPSRKGGTMLRTNRCTRAPISSS